MTYSVVFSRRAKKFIDKLEKVERQRIKEGIDALRESPAELVNPSKAHSK
jgi:mRNA-degrading endonuclease RelE of RelBE toxin-antitoxin system